MDLPMGWARVDDAVVEHARRKAHEALADPGGVAGRLADYYRREGNFAGATFTELRPNPSHELCATDLLAVSMLSVEIPAIAVRRIAEPGETAARLSQLLSEDAIGVTVTLPEATPRTLATMGEFYEAVKGALTPVGAARSDRWVTASKICARKRPLLFPVRDRVVTAYLGTRRLKSCAADWQVFRALLRDEVLMERLRHAVEVAESQPGVAVGDPNALLRHLDVALWTYAAKP